MSLRQKVLLVFAIAVAVYALLSYAALRAIVWPQTPETAQITGTPPDELRPVLEGEGLFRYVFLSTLVVGMLVLFFMAWVLRRVFAAPVLRVTSHMAAINRSDDLLVHLSTHRALTHLALPAHDEIGTLAREFNTMVQRLQHDMAERRRQGLVLQESEARIRAIVESAADAIITIDDSGIVESYNPAAVEMFGYEGEDLAGNNVDVLVEGREEDKGKLIPHGNETGQTHRQGEMQGRRRDGSTFPLHMTVREMHLGERRMYTVILRDITELRRMHEKVLQSQHLATIGEMGASLAHEIRNPVAAISGAMQVLRKSMEADDAQREVAGEILEQINRIDSTVRYLLSFAKPWSPSKQACDMNMLVEEVIGAAKQADRYADVRFLCDDNGAIEAMVDPSLVQRILWNVFDNAADAMDGHGEIHWRIQAPPEGIEVRIRDTGPGISQEEADKVFRPFFTTKTHGTGLGLAICQRIMEAHGGAIQMAPSPEGGTEVVLTFPKETVL